MASARLSLDRLTGLLPLGLLAPLLLAADAHPLSRLPADALAW